MYDIGKQLLFANNRNRVRGAVLGLSQDGACTDLFENLSVNVLKGDLLKQPLSKHLFSHLSIPLTRFRRTSEVDLIPGPEQSFVLVHFLRWLFFS
jgi:hypothetical protein